MRNYRKAIGAVLGASAVVAALAVPASADQNRGLRLGPNSAQPMFGPRIDSAPARWDGLYVGATFGGVMSEANASRTSYGGPLISLDVENGLFPSGIGHRKVKPGFGLALGYNRQTGRIVTGAELDVTFLNADFINNFSRVDPNPMVPFFGVDTNTQYQTKLKGLATARLKAGYAIGPWLVYATGGLALGRVENRFSLELPQMGYSSPDWSQSGTKFGYTIGAGIEHQIGERMSIRAEVLHYDLRDTKIHAADPVTFPGQHLQYRFDNSGILARVGLNVRF